MACQQARLAPHIKDCTMTVGFVRYLKYNSGLRGVDLTNLGAYRGQSSVVCAFPVI